MAYAYSTVPYYSMDVARNVTLIYNQDRVDPKPFIHVNVTHGGGSPRPVKYLLKVMKATGGFIRFLNGDSVLAFDSMPGTFRIGGQFNAGTNGIGSTGVYSVEVRVIAQYSGVSDTAGTTVSTKVAVVNETDSDLARGLTLAGVQRLYNQGDTLTLITTGNGSAVVFEKVGGNWVSPPGEFSRLETLKIHIVITGWRRSYPDSTKVSFNLAGRATEATDKFGNTTTFSYYDGYRSNLLQYITDPFGKAIRLNYGAWALDSVIDPMGRGSRLDVDYATRRVNNVVDPDGVATTLRYDTKLRLDSVRSRGGSWTVASYGSGPLDSADKVFQVTAPSIAVFPSSTAQPTTTFTPWQVLGVPYSATTSVNAIPVLADTARARITDPEGHLSRFSVDRWGQPTTLLDPLGDTTRTVYDSNGLVRAVRIPAYAASGARDTFAYDGSGLLTYMKSAGGDSTRIRYAAFAQPDSIWGSGFAVRDSLLYGFVVWRRVGGQYTTSFTYTSGGRIESVFDPAGHLLGMMRYAGVNGNKSFDSLPGGRYTTWLYDQFGRDSVVAVLGGGGSNTYYNRMNQPVRTFRLNVTGDSTVLTYDTLTLDLIKVRDAIGQVYEFKYNALAWLTARKDPATAKWDSLAYDRDGQLRRRYARRDSTWVNLTYDALHRQTTKSGRMTDSTTVAYSQFGRVVTGTSAASTETIGFNVRGQPDSVVTIVGGHSYKRYYAYSTAGLLDSLWGSGMSNTPRRFYAYSPNRGTLDSILLGSNLTALRYDNELKRSRLVTPGPDSVTAYFTTVHGTWRTTATAAPAPAISRSYQSDSLGRIGRWSDSSFTKPDTLYNRDYYYDLAGRLSNIDYGARGSCSYNPDYGQDCTGFSVDSSRVIAYDRVGNRTDDSASYDPTPSNRLVRFKDYTYSNDADGNRISMTYTGTTPDTLWWSAENRLDSTSNYGSRLRLSYDAFGRLAKRTYGGVTYFLWNGDQLYAEVDSATGERVTEYSWYPGTDRLHATLSGSAATRRYAHQDAMGNVIAFTDESHNVQTTVKYDEWGTSTGGAGRLPLFKGSLLMNDVDTHFYYMRNRWYDSYTGRFLSEDPAGVAGGVNPYVFAANDPVNSSDPDGLMMVSSHKWSSNNCWNKFACNPEGIGHGGSGDWNGDGWDDFALFGAWSWGRQRFIGLTGQAGQHLEPGSYRDLEWDGLWAAIQDIAAPEVRAIAMQAAFWGDIQSIADPLGKIAFTTFPKPQSIGGTTYPGNTIYINSMLGTGPSLDVFYEIDTHRLAFILSHELWHYIGHHGDRSEPGANCFARQAVGYGFGRGFCQ